MKVLNLQCQHLHCFEGWFASEHDFQSQSGRGLVECPLCADKEITKLPSAPRLSLSASREAAPAAAAGAKQEVMRAAGDAQTQALWLKMMRHMMQNSEDVGERFAEEARSIHYGESEERSIRGQASREETLELLEEGIDVMPLPVPRALKEPLQ
jgi:hypothetical protein